MPPPIRVLVPRPLEPYAEGFRAELAAQGYSALSARNLMRLMAHLSRWLHEHRLRPQVLTLPRIRQYLRARRRASYTAWLSERGSAPLLSYLRRLQVCRCRVPERYAHSEIDSWLAMKTTCGESAWPAWDHHPALPGCGRSLSRPAPPP